MFVTVQTHIRTHGQWPIKTILRFADAQDNKPTEISVRCSEMCSLRTALGVMC